MLSATDCCGCDTNRFSNPWAERITNNLFHAILHLVAVRERGSHVIVISTRPGGTAQVDSSEQENQGARYSYDFIAPTSLIIIK